MWKGREFKTRPRRINDLQNASFLLRKWALDIIKIWQGMDGSVSGYSIWMVNMVLVPAAGSPSKAALQSCHEYALSQNDTCPNIPEALLGPIAPTNKSDADPDMTLDDARK